MSTTLKVLNAKTVIAEHKIKQGETLTLLAKGEANYQLIDDKTGVGPENIITKREGNDLKIFLKDGDMKEDIVIKDYYDEETGKETSNLLIGQADNGKIYAYIPESGVKADAVSLLADQVTAPQILGGDELASAFWTFNPWWLAALVPLAAGIAIAASNSGSGSSNNNGSNNEEPNNTDPAADAKAAVDAAEKAAKELADLVKAKEADGSITPEEKAELDAKKAEADKLKDDAKAAVDALPADNADKAGLDAKVDAIDNQVPDVTAEPYPLPDQTDTSTWEDDGEDSDNPTDKDSADDNEVDDTPQLDPNVIITGRPIPSANPSKFVVNKIKEKNPNSLDQINDKAQINGNEAANLVVVGRGTDSTNISGRQSITAGSIKTNGGDDTVVITNNVIRSTIDTGADNDKLDIRGNSRTSTLSMGTGDDVLTIRGKLAGLNNQVNLGDGDDTMIVAGGAVFNNAAASDHQTKTNWNKIDLGAGNDKLSMGEKGAGNIQYTDIQAGTGDDVITLSPNRGKGDLFWVNVDLGDGNDELIVKASDLRMTYINGGEGNDTIDLSQAQFTTTYHTHVGDTRIDGGNGNDKIILGDVGYTTDTHYYKITGGAGDDVVEFTQDYSIHEYNNRGAEINTNRNQVDIQGGEGFDTISIIGSGTTVDMSSGTSGSNRPEGLRDFEAVDMTASGAQTVKVKLADVLANSGTLYIAGDSSDTIDLGSDGNSSLGGFSKTTETTTRTALDGSEHTYTAYTNGAAKVYIDDSVTNII
ncbi:hypothetical protein [Rodentibacter sp. Ppn85]|uniref:GA-like domain-containing protein n=1 Tax=Rodentibacter sp. Ppn85 TaxID=1908525 RepID=UPI0009872977|nr:hypothetical protein [Rodentibacter sp. Ppn85]OOF64236.1 hypothetical protein BKL51_07640 [Rodentibacter sp. Ppn85]